MEDTVSILRGLKDKYEQHHGVRITDSRDRRRRDAVAPLHRRPLPARTRRSTSIDEAAARLKMQVDSKPEELDSIDREIVRAEDRAGGAEEENPTAARKTGSKRLEGELD